MAEINKENSAARLAALKKCAAERTEAVKYAQVSPVAAKTVAPSATNATPRVSTQLLHSAMKNPLNGVPVQGALQRLRQKQKAQAVMKAKMAETQSAARLAALKKCAAADRSAARRMLLAKCAADIPPPDSIQWKLLDAVDPNRVGVGAQTYINALQPANLGALAGIAGGAGLVGSAINPDKERSLTSRAIRGAGGLGLMAGGTYLAANDKAREKFTKALLSLIGKARVGVAKNLGV